jgi:hypothetical protein
MTSNATFALARDAAAEFNRKHGGTYLQVAEPAPELLTFEEVRAQAEKMPGEYIAANLFRAVKGRTPSRSEAVRLGHQLGHLRVARRKTGPYTLWLLDKAFSERSH